MAITLVTGCLGGCLARWLIGWLVCSSAEFALSAGYWDRWLFVWMVGSRSEPLISCPTGWSADQPIDFLFGELVDYLFVSRQVNLLAGWWRGWWLVYLWGGKATDGWMVSWLFLGWLGQSLGWKRSFMILYHWPCSLWKSGSVAWFLLLFFLCLSSYQTVPCGLQPHEAIPEWGHTEENCGVGK